MGYYNYRDEKKGVNHGRLVFGVFVIFLMVSSIFMGFTSMNSIYQIEWRERFANQHLDLAQASSSASTQYKEIALANKLFDVFPKEGNFDYWNKLNPKTNMANTWMALKEMEEYAGNSAKLNNTDPAYQIAVYNTQEKIQYFQDNYNDSFNAYITLGAGGWVGALGTITGFISVVFLAIIWWWAASDESKYHWMWFVLMLPLLFAAVFFMWAYISPVFYAGPL